MLVVAALLLASGVDHAPVSEARLLGALQTARREAALDPLERRPELDAAALARARIVGALPERRRLTHDEPIGSQLAAAGVERFRHVSLHLDLKRGYDDYEAAFLESWREHGKAWDNALRPDNDAIGLAVHVSDDGWVILAVILLQDVDVIPLPDRIVIERQAMRAVNAVRREHGLTELVPDGLLSRIARSHSEDMARRGYFAHASPEGERSSQRVKRHGVEYAKLGENLHRSRNVRDPARTAVASWMRSKGHRKAILTPEYEETGMGVALGENGEILFTQLFLVPRR
jgi:uncharacterized protein YkwD